MRFHICLCQVILDSSGRVKPDECEFLDFSALDHLGVPPRPLCESSGRTLNKIAAFATIAKRCADFPSTILSGTSWSPTVVRSKPIHGESSWRVAIWGLNEGSMREMGTYDKKKLDPQVHSYPKA